MTQVKAHRVPFVMDLPYSIMKIYFIFRYHKFNLYVVGGAVRDAWMRKSPKDFDLATDAHPDVVEQLLAEAHIPTVATGKAFGVINAFPDADEYEIATFRTDYYQRDDLEKFKDYLKSLNNGSYEKFIHELMK